VSYSTIDGVRVREGGPLCIVCKTNHVKKADLPVSPFAPVCDSCVRAGVSRPGALSEPDWEPVPRIEKPKPKPKPGEPYTFAIPPKALAKLEAAGWRGEETPAEGESTPSQARPVAGPDFDTDSDIPF
jgi:hypothetical protein